ncbi:hypothetical protein Drorol1_Dr00013193 [Drosera rotundifolia]
MVGRSNVRGGQDDDGDCDLGTLEGFTTVVTTLQATMATRDEMAAKEERDEQGFWRIEQRLEAIVEQLDSLVVARNRDGNGNREHLRMDGARGAFYDRAIFGNNSHDYNHLAEDSDEEEDMGFNNNQKPVGQNHGRYDRYEVDRVDRYCSSSSNFKHCTCFAHRLVLRQPSLPHPPDRTTITSASLRCPPLHQPRTAPSNSPDIKLFSLRQPKSSTPGTKCFAPGSCLPLLAGQRLVGRRASNRCWAAARETPGSKPTRPGRGFVGHAGEEMFHLDHH